MNRIYNVIWSKTKKCYVVVSEIVKTGGGKVKSIQSGTTWARMSAIMAVAALLMVHIMVMRQRIQMVHGIVHFTITKILVMINL